VSVRLLVAEFCSLAPRRGRTMSDDLLDLFLSATEDYGIILLDADGRVHRWSRGAERLFGFQANEVIGTLAHEIFVPPDRKAGVPEIELQTATEQGRAEDERWHLRKDGTRFWASGVMIALRDNGVLRGYAKVVRDFTERRRLEEAVRRTQKLESVGVLAAGVAHDFNNVLTAILGNVSLVRRRLADVVTDGDIDGMLASAERASNRAADLVKQLLNYAGTGRREMRPVDICQVTKDALAIVQASVSRKIRILRDVPQSCPMIPADVGQLQQLVLNLVLNGAESIGENHGEVSVRVRVRDVPLSWPKCMPGSRCPSGLIRKSRYGIPVSGWMRIPCNAFSTPSSQPSSWVGAWDSPRHSGLSAAMVAASPSKARPAREPRLQSCCRLSSIPVMRH